jgi:hypothetical protein
MVCFIRYIVDNSTSFDEKIRRAVARISRLVGAPAPLALTRKFLLARPPSVEELEMHLERFESFEVCCPARLAVDCRHHLRCAARRGWLLIAVDCSRVCASLRSIAMGGTVQVDTTYQRSPDDRLMTA